MSRLDYPLPPFGTDSGNAGGGNSSSINSRTDYFSYAQGNSQAPAPRPLPSAAGAFNGGLLGPRLTSTNQQYGQRAQPVNPISWRKSSSSLSHSSILPSLPSVPGASAPPGGPPTTTDPPRSAQGTTQPPWVNQAADSASRARSAAGGSGQPFNPTQHAHPPAASNQVKFHRARSSFIPNKWTRGPGDGTFGSIYLSYGGGEYGGKNFGGGPNLSFDRKRPEEIWEEEQARKRQSATGGASTKKKTKKPKAKKEKRPAAGSKEAQARKLLTRARNQLLAHLSAPSCRLFSEADHVVAVSDDDLDDLLRAGGGDASKVISYLTDFDRSNRKFDNFQELMVGIQEARKEKGDFGLGTEAEVDAGQDGGPAQEDEPTQQPPAEEEEKTADDTQQSNESQPPQTQRSEDFVQEPAADGSGEEAKSPNGTAKKKKPSKAAAGGARGPTIAEKRAAKKLEEEESKRQAEQQRKNNVAKQSAARAAKVQAEKEKKQSNPGASAAAVTTPTKRSSATSTVSATPKKDAEEAKEETSAAAPASAVKNPDESYGEEGFDE